MRSLCSTSGLAVALTQTSPSSVNPNHEFWSHSIPTSVTSLHTRHVIIPALSSSGQMTKRNPQYWTSYVVSFRCSCRNRRRANFGLWSPIASGSEVPNRLRPNRVTKNFIPQSPQYPLPLKLRWDKYMPCFSLTRRSFSEDGLQTVPRDSAP